MGSAPAGSGQRLGLPARPHLGFGQDQQGELPVLAPVAAQRWPHCPPSAGAWGEAGGGGGLLLDRPHWPPHHGPLLHWHSATPLARQRVQVNKWVLEGTFFPLLSSLMAINFFTRGFLICENG